MYANANIHESKSMAQKYGEGPNLFIRRKHNLY